MEKAKANLSRLPMLSVMGRVKHPAMMANPFRLDQQGHAHVLSGTGGITYNVRIGDSVFGMECDHVEPGVTVKNADELENNALNTLSCIGNCARVISGDAKGGEGFVTGTHGGVEHLLCYFPQETLDSLAIGDKIQVRAQGQGMQIEGFEDTVNVMNLSPRLFEKMNMGVENGKLHVKVAARVPACLMGSGIGSVTAYRGDYDIMTADRQMICRLGLDKLRYGDIVLLEDCDNSYGRGFLSGAVTVGVVIHSDCILIGHGPGVTGLMTSKTPVIEGHLDPQANLADLLR